MIQREAPFKSSTAWLMSCSSSGGALCPAVETSSRKTNTAYRTWLVRSISYDSLSKLSFRWVFIIVLRINTWTSIVILVSSLNVGL